MNIEELKSALAKEEKALNNPKLSFLHEKIKTKIDKLQKELSDAENKAEKKVDAAEKKVEKAETKTEKKEAKEDLKEAKEEAKEVAKAVTKAEKIEDKVEDLTGAVKGKRKGSARIEKMPPMKRKSMARPAKYKPKSDKPVFVRKKKATKKEVVKSEKGKVKTVRAFGQTVEYRNDSEFCSQLIKAFKKRRTVYKSKKKRTKPVFGVITSKVKDAVTKAIDNAPKAEIKENPKAFLAKAQRLEKSAIKFLEDFKAILGSDYKKSEISAEFGDLEKSIKQLVSKYK